MGQNRTCARSPFKLGETTLRSPRPRIVFSNRRLAATAVALLGLALVGCSPFYVMRVGWSQIGILRSRVPLTEVMTDPDVPAPTRARLRLAWDARAFAVDQLGFQNSGGSYTSFAPLASDTLALVLSGARVDRLEFRTWWFPIIGRIPYRAYFSVESAEAARDDLEDQGFDTYLRPTAAFSTLGWFDDPLYSTLMGRDDVALVETVLHELAHNHLYVPNHGRFNESYAQFVGLTGSIEFFCRDTGLMTVRCLRALDRWEDAKDVSRFVDRVVDEIVEFYASTPSEVGPALLAERDEIYASAQEEFVRSIQPNLRATTYGFLATDPLNNATLLSRSLYYHRLPGFGDLRYSWEGDYRSMLAWIRETAPELDDPFDLLDLSPPTRGVSQ